MFASADRLLEKLSCAAIIALAFVLLALVGVADYLTGYEISFGLFYLAPVGIAAWYAGRRTGLAFAVASSIVWYVAELIGGLQYSHPVVMPIWNAFVRLSFFLTIAVLLYTLRGRLSTERQLATTDALTGALNLRAFAERLDHDLALNGRTGGVLTLAYIDLDDFKQINDTFGHAEGDRLLRAVGRILVEGTRSTDTVARLGGDEFALILPGMGLEGSDILLSKIRQQLSESLVRGTRSVTCSIGAVVFREQPPSVEDAIETADRLMYSAKAQGKNTVVSQVYARTTTEVDSPQRRRTAAADKSRHTANAL